MNNKALLEQGAAKLGVPLTDPQSALLLRYLQELEKWSKRINLVSKESSSRDILEKHFLDSLTLMPLLQKHCPPGVDQPSLLDVGTGAGFPGLVLASVLPDFQFTLVEPRKKRVSFLGHIIRTLGLTNVRVVPDRLETMTREIGFSFITSRAVAEPVKFVEMIAPHVKPHTRVILMLARQPVWDRFAMETENAYQPCDQQSFNLPFSGDPRLLILL